MTRINARNGYTMNDRPVAHACASLLTLRKRSPRTRYEVADFLAVAPKRSSQWCIYADPPYAGDDVTDCHAVDDFDHAAFWTRCQQWAALGAVVLVSEYTCPVPHRVLFRVARNVALKHGVKVTEHLYEVLPCPAAR